MSEKELKRITFLVSVDVYEALRKRAFDEHKAMSDFIRDGLQGIINTPGYAQPKWGGDRHNKPAQPKTTPNRAYSTPGTNHRLPSPAQTTVDDDSERYADIDDTP